MVDLPWDRPDPVGDDSASEVRQAVFHCEALKLSLSHTKDGVKVVLLIQPADVPSALFTDLIGQRYMLALAKIGDDERPVPRPEVQEAQKAVVRAALLCRDGDFQRWLFMKGYAEEMSEEKAAEALRGMLQVKSRSELADNPEARKKLASLIDEWKAGQ